MKKITLFILLLSISSLEAQTIVRKNGLGSETTSLNGYSSSSFFSGESIVVGLGVNYYVLEEFDLNYQQLMYLCPEISVEYITGWEPLKLKLMAGPGWDEWAMRSTFHSAAGMRIDWI